MYITHFKFCTLHILNLVHYIFQICYITHLKFCIFLISAAYYIYLAFSSCNRSLSCRVRVRIRFYDEKRALPCTFDVPVRCLCEWIKSSSVGGANRTNSTFSAIGWVVVGEIHHEYRAFGLRRTLLIMGEGPLFVELIFVD